MSTMEHFRITRERVKVLGGIAVLVALYALASESDIRDAERLQALREERAASLAAGVCLPRPGQETRWQWQTADGQPIHATAVARAESRAEALRLVCEIREAPAGYGRAPNVIFTAAPAGLDRLALFAGDPK